MGKIILTERYSNVISLENLLEAWKEFLNGKRSRSDVQQFERNLMSNLISLHQELTTKSYKHSSYEAFGVADPKPRSIHKASVRDRLLHHALYRKLCPFFDKTFIADSYSCRIGKGTHKAMERFNGFFNRMSDNHTKTVWVLKCDIRKFFASVDQSILMEILKAYISDKDIIWLLAEIIGSFYSTRPNVGLPLGNLTSQLFVNIYMNRFDQFIKHRLKARYYIRYADDFTVMHSSKDYLLEILPKIADFLSDELKLSLHPDKVSIETLASGIDFLGWVHFPKHRVLRTVTKKRMLRGIKRSAGKPETVQSYIGLLKHGNARKLASKVQKLYQLPSMM
jgi:RNA-directed DNA polymerase